MALAQIESFGILFPEPGTRTGGQLIGYAIDHLASEYMAAHPELAIDDPAIDVNAQVGSVAEAIEILDDAGLFTFVRGARARAEILDDLDRRARAMHPSRSSEDS